VNNTLQRLTLILAVAAISLSVYGLVRRTPTLTSAHVSALDGIQRNRTVRVGYVRFAPCADINPTNGQLEGIFVDAMREIATDMKLQVEFKETTLANFSAALEAGEFDFSIGPTFITPTRSAAVSFTQPILALGNSGLVKRQNAGAFASVESLSKPGVRVAVLQGQAMEQFVRSRFPQAELIVIAGSDLTAPLSAVEAGQAEIGLTNSVTVQQYASQHQDTVVVFTNEDALVRLALAWVVRADDDRLKSFLNSSIQWLIQSGKLDSIQSKYPIHLSKLH
jgi:ABC-type amino acid transport substrate-binding protein